MFLHDDQVLPPLDVLTGGQPGPTAKKILRFLPEGGLTDRANGSMILLRRNEAGQTAKILKLPKGPAGAPPLIKVKRNGLILPVMDPTVKRWHVDHQVPEINW